MLGRPGLCREAMWVGLLVYFLRVLLLDFVLGFWLIGGVLFVCVFCFVFDRKVLN